MNTGLLLTNEQYTALYAHVERLVNRTGCSHTLRRTRAYLRSQGVDVRANIAKIADLGGHCDCEVLMNVTPSEYAERREEPLAMEAILGEAASDEYVSHTMLKAIQHTLW